ncbi:pleckstrin homology-like domain family B member 1 [Watersipora subatra]|uniref:pleckstrin homology-like domain family B member 1 n=1 Tax=Watersipora subatra TaxID=2589382 RepID=UPI00355B269D
MPAPRQISKVSTNSSSTSKTSLLEQSGPALLVTPSSSAVAASTGNPLIHSTNKEEDDNVYCNVDRAPSITPVQRKDSGVELPSQGSVEIENTYANTEPPCMQDPRFSAVQGIPLPPAVRGSGDTAAVTPLSEEVRQLLDPVEYMSLWELRSQLPPYAASGSASQPTEPPRSMEAPPVLGKKKSGPPIPPRESEKLNTFGQASFPAVSDSLSTDEHEPPKFICPPAAK